MEIKNDQSPPAVGITATFLRQQQPDQSFVSMLDSERLKAEGQATREAVLASQQSKPAQPKQEEIDFIREHGMIAFVEEVHKKKMEELREKILEAMGLDEEALSKMPADQRREIEKMIAMEIQNRLAANSLYNTGSESNNTVNSQITITEIGPSNQLAAQAMAGDPGSLVGMVISQETDHGDQREEQNSKPKNG